MEYSIIEQLAKDKIIERIVDNIASELDSDKEDLKQDIYLELLTKNQDFIKRLYEDGKLKYYIIKMISNNIKSNTSPYYYKYKKYKERLTFIENYEELDDED